MGGWGNEGRRGLILWGSAMMLLQVKYHTGRCNGAANLIYSKRDIDREREQELSPCLLAATSTEETAVSR